MYRRGSEQELKKIRKKIERGQKWERDPAREKKKK